jgi:hypothetical protein
MCARPDPSSGAGEKPVATASEVLNNFGIDNWNAKVYGSLSTAAQLSLLVKNRAQALRMSYLLWKLNSQTAKFFQEVDDVMTGKHVAAQTQPCEPISLERLEQSRDSLIQLGINLGRIYEDARRNGLTNHSLIAGPVTALRAHADHFLELAEWFDSFQHMDEIEQAFASAREEKRLGEVYDLSQVQ